MIVTRDGGAQGQAEWGPGIVGVRCIMTGCYGIRVERELLPKLRDVPGLTRPNPSSDLFCVRVDGWNNSPESAVKRFREIMAREGLGKLFGCAAPAPAPARKEPASKAAVRKAPAAKKSPIAKSKAPAKKKVSAKKAAR